ncbi:hypothetical protein J22TS3_10550 [Paenibacillus sp. J22TS3]|nr:hypothetical protein J22TS3_10550 [Paenibacillus sp. J22TS3]
MEWYRGEDDVKRHRNQFSLGVLVSNASTFPVEITPNIGQKSDYYDRVKIQPLIWEFYRGKPGHRNV